MTTTRNIHPALIPHGRFAVSHLTVDELEAFAAHTLPAEVAAHFEAISDAAWRHEAKKAELPIFFRTGTGRIKASGFILYTDKDRIYEPAEYAKAPRLQRSRDLRDAAQELGGSLTYSRGSGTYSITLPATFAGWRLLSELVAPYTATIHVDVACVRTGKNVADRIPSKASPEKRAAQLQELRREFVLLMRRLAKHRWQEREEAEATAAEARATASRFFAVSRRFRAMVEGAAKGEG